SAIAPPVWWGESPSRRSSFFLPQPLVLHLELPHRRPGTRVPRRIVGPHTPPQPLGWERTVGVLGRGHALADNERRGDGVRVVNLNGIGRCPRHIGPVKRDGLSG